jgi:membrane protease YdiL (CAAX protease family)
MTRDQTVVSTPSFRNISPGTVAAAAILGWIVMEVGLRWRIAPMLAAPLGSALGVETGVSVITFVLSVIGLALFSGGIAWGGWQFGITPSEWDYTFSVRSVAAGVASVVGYFVVYFAVVALVILAGMGPSSSANAASGGVELPLWAIGAFLLANGVLVPIIEELAWRGVIQTGLMESYGVIVGSVLTAAAFVLKHVIVDWGEPWSRLVALIILALLWCGLRVRFGTLSSTISHIGVNTISTALLISASL